MAGGLVLSSLAGALPVHPPVGQAGLPQMNFAGRCGRCYGRRHWR